MSQPPFFWRCINAIRAWREQDDRLRVEHFRATFKPEPKPKQPLPFKNLILIRGERRKIVA